VPLKANVDEALKQCPEVTTVLVIRRTGNNANLVRGRDHDYDAEKAKVSADCPPEPMGAEDPLFILYTSGSTGRPACGHDTKSKVISMTEVRRARDLGIHPGILLPGPLNAITDVAGVKVGQVTLIEGNSIRTGQ